MSFPIAYRTQILGVPKSLKDPHITRVLETPGPHIPSDMGPPRPHITRDMGTGVPKLGGPHFTQTPVAQRKRQRDAADIGSPSSASTPRGRPPAQKRPLVVREEKSHTRRSLEFGPDPSVNQAGSPVVNVVSMHSRNSTAYTHIKIATSPCPFVC